MNLETQQAIEDYSASHRALEIAAIVASASLAMFLAARIGWAASISHLWLIGAAAVAGYVAADFMSGLVHWLFDTWGGMDTPVLGRSFIRPFREHHWDEKAITRHDFIETHGNNCLAALPVLLGACTISPGSDVEIFAAGFLLFTSLSVLATNQFHKWAHIEKPGRLVERLQKWRLILPSDHHRVHHAAPCDTQYCITTGWLNPLFNSTGFFRGMEWVITTVTGAKPRGTKSRRTLFSDVST